MSIKNRFIIFLLFFLGVGFLVLAVPQDSSDAVVPVTNCCIEHGGTGCTDPTCEDFICSFDPFCCNVEWDDICVDEAEDFCEVCGGSPVTTRPIPTMNQWGLIALAGILGLSALYILARRNPLKSS